MRFVPKKTLDQQDVQALYRARQKLVNHRTALISRMRGLLLDRGIAIGVAATRARRLIPQILAEPNDELTGLMREIIASLYAFMLQIDERIRASIKRATPSSKRAKLAGGLPKSAASARRPRLP
jgi:transposase